MNSSKPIMLVEDDEVDALTVKRALNDLKVANPFVQLPNGEEALAYLRNSANRKPCVILLDLNMPKMGGLDFLKVLKADDDLKLIPVIILTTSRSEQDKVNSFDWCAAGYIVKPADYQKFVDAIRTVDLYWTVSELPASVG